MAFRQSKNARVLTLLHSTLLQRMENRENDFFGGVNEAGIDFDTALSIL